MRRFPFVLVALVIPAALYACGDEAEPATANAAEAGAGSEVTTPDATTPVDAVALDTAADTAALPDTALDQSTTEPVRCSQAELDAPCGDAGGACTDPVQNAQIDIVFASDGIATQYTNHCVKVKVGTVIDFTGSFAEHPLEPKGGDTPNPIPLTTSLNEPDAGPSGNPELLLTMTRVGTFGYECNLHPSVMFGAIQVVP